LAEELEDIEKAGAEMVHLDVMDGHFVPNITFGMPVVANLRLRSALQFDVHLMVEEPIRFIEGFKRAGADLITVHAEACKDVKATLEAIENAEILAGLSIRPGTPFSSIVEYLPHCDVLLIITVEPGKGGQALIPETLDKVREARKYIEENRLFTRIEVDGGINPETAKAAVDAGAQILVAGSSVFCTKLQCRTEAAVKEIACDVHGAAHRDHHASHAVPLHAVSGCGDRRNVRSAQDSAVSICGKPVVQNKAVPAVNIESCSAVKATGILRLDLEGIVYTDPSSSELIKVSSRLSKNTSISSMTSIIILSS
jgi:ribulose-phosphate 3-epimerase